MGIRNIVFGMVFSTVMLACGGNVTPPNVPPNVPTDVGAATACVLTQFLAQQPVTPCVTQFGPELVNDVLQTLLNSKSQDAITYAKVQRASLGK